MPRFFHPLLSLLASATQRELLAQLQYLKTENEILRARLPTAVRVSREERAKLVRLGKLVGSAITGLVTIVSPGTFLRWLREERRAGNASRPQGRPRKPLDVEELIVRLARETGWGYTRIWGELRKLGTLNISRTTVVNILRRQGFDLGPQRGEGSWKEFLHMHASTLWACDFLSKRVWNGRRCVEYFILFVIHVESRRVCLLGITALPNRNWMAQRAQDLAKHLRLAKAQSPKLIHDADGRFKGTFDETLQSNGVEIVRLPPASPNLNAYAERWVQSIQRECLDHFVVLGERHLRHLVSEYLAHYHRERPHQGVGNRLLIGAADSAPPDSSTAGPIRCRSRLGGLLRHYERCAA